MGILLILLGLASMAAGGYGMYIVSQISYSAYFDDLAMFGEMMGMFGDVDPKIQFGLKVAELRYVLLIVGAVLVILGIVIKAMKKNR